MFPATYMCTRNQGTITSYARVKAMNTNHQEMEHTVTAQLSSISEKHTTNGNNPGNSEEQKPW